MPEPEFEVYLSLLSKLLHLTSAQRAEITAELRDHLEERLHELEAQGHARGRAIAIALEEFGDAAALAQHITLPHLALRRRQLMRYSLGSIAVITVTFVLASFYWPAQRPEPAVQAIAQAPSDRPSGSVAKALLDAISKQNDNLRQQVEDKLARRDVLIQFEDTPLEEVLMFLSDQLDLDFVLDRKLLADQGVDPGAPVTLRLRQQSVTVRTVLELVLRQVGDVLSYVIRDGMVLITTPNEGYEVQVYDCRDLLANVKVESPGSAVPAGAALPGMAGGGGYNPVGGAEGVGGIGAGGLGGGIGNYPGGATSPAGTALINVVMAATGDHWLSSDGEGGTIAEFDGLLIVRHSQRTHRSIEDLLTKMREKKGRPTTATGPVYYPALHGAGPTIPRTADPTHPGFAPNSTTATPTEVPRTPSTPSGLEPDLFPTRAKPVLKR